MGPTATAEEAALLPIVAPVVEGLGFALVRLRLSGSRERTLQIMAERPADADLDIEECATISRALSEVLDAADPIEGGYRLEVSSPGIDRPLTRPEDFDRWSGFEAKVELAEKIENRKRFQGRLLGRDETDELVVIDAQGLGEIGIPIASVQSAKLMLTDALIAATAPKSVPGLNLA